MGREQFVGTWKLIALEANLPDGSVVQPFGEAPIGLAVFSEGGHMAAQLMKPGRPRFASDDQAKGTPEEVAGAFAGYVAYFGRFDVDEETRTMVTHVEGSLFPNWIGGNQVRTYEFRNGRLLLMPPALTIGGQTFTSTLTWERA